MKTLTHSYTPHPDFSSCGSLLRINSSKHQIRRLRVQEGGSWCWYGWVHFTVMPCLYMCKHTVRIFSVQSQLLKLSSMSTSLFFTPNTKWICVSVDSILYLVWGCDKGLLGQGHWQVHRSDSASLWGVWDMWRPRSSALWVTWVGRCTVRVNETSQATQDAGAFPQQVIPK